MNITTCVAGFIENTVTKGNGILVVYLPFCVTTNVNFLSANSPQFS